MNDLTLDNIGTNIRRLYLKQLFSFTFHAFICSLSFSLERKLRLEPRHRAVLTVPSPARNFFFFFSRQTADKSKPAVNLGEVVVEFVPDLLCIYTSSKNEGQTTGVKKHCESIFQSQRAGNFQISLFLLVISGRVQASFDSIHRFSDRNILEI